MKYAVLCYHAENVVCAWSREHDEAVLGKLAVVQERRARMGQLGPVARLMPTTAATTLRQDQGPAAVLDGPFIRLHLDRLDAGSDAKRRAARRMPARSK